MSMKKLIFTQWEKNFANEKQPKKFAKFCKTMLSFDMNNVCSKITDYWEKSNAQESRSVFL